MKPEDLKNYGELFGFVCAGVYFAYRAFTGYFITNLSTAITCTRQPIANQEHDDLVVAITLAKGDRGSVNIHDAQARVTSKRGPAVPDSPAPLLGFERKSLHRRTLADGAPYNEIDWKKRSASSPFLRLTPGEQTTFSCSFVVPRDSVCEVEVIVMGQNPMRWKVGQWRASAIALPKDPSAVAPPTA